METAIDVKTDLWNNVVFWLLDNKWEVAYKYDLFDAGIDYDLIILKKGDELVKFGWDNWMEGEIQCSTKNMNAIEVFIKQRLKRGKPNNLKEEVTSLFWS